jgi:hypothetical protein
MHRRRGESQEQKENICLGMAFQVACPSRVSARSVTVGVKGGARRYRPWEQDPVASARVDDQGGLLAGGFEPVGDGPEGCSASPPPTARIIAAVAD